MIFMWRSAAILDTRRIFLTPGNYKNIAAISGRMEKKQVLNGISWKGFT